MHVRVLLHLRVPLLRDRLIHTGPKTGDSFAARSWATLVCAGLAQDTLRGVLAALGNDGRGGARAA
jgi:hypothetical protein